jgi:hypothetical protein
MVTTAEKIAQMELALAQAREEHARENGRRFEILMREMSPEEKQRILDNLTDRQERVLFGLEAPAQSTRPAKSGGTLSCPYCPKTGLTDLGLKLHIARKHKDEQGSRAGTSDMFGAEEPKTPRRRTGRATEAEPEEDDGEQE